MNPYPTCPTCGSAAVPLLFGLAGPVAVQAARAGKLTLGGCRVAGDGTDPNWCCIRRRWWQPRHRWRDPDLELWEAALAEALA